ncbi:MAG: DUF5132 domain-containing protein [Rhodopila sp.]
MALEDIFKGGNILTGLAIGAGVTLAIRLVPGVAGAAGAVLRPVAKLAITTGVTAYEGMRGVVAQGAETVSDLVAEAQHELAAAKTAQGQSLPDAITDL